MTRSSQHRWLLLCVASTAMACSSSSPPAQTQSLSLHQPPRLLHATRLGRADGSQQIDLTIGLKRRAGSDLKGFLERVKQPRSGERFLSPEEFGDRFAPDVTEYAQLVDWLVAHGIEVTRQEPSRTTVSARGTISAVEAAFHTELSNYSDSLGRFRAPSVEPHFDVNFVAYVAGLNDANRYFTHMTPMAPPPPPGNDAGGGPLGPADLRALYGADKTTGGPGNTPLQGDGQTIVILSSGYPPDPVGDVDPFIKKFALPTNRKAQYAQIFLGGPNKDPDSEANNAYGENLLDIDMAMGVAPNSSFVHVFASTLDFMFENGIPWIINSVPEAHAASLSWGSCDRGAEGEAILFDDLFQQAKAQGQQWFVSAGDYGSDGCGDVDAMSALAADWPASDPFVIGVGGTELAKGVEVAWNDGGEKDEGGGGQSELFDKPAYQDGVGPYPNDGVRDVPDVAAMAGAPGVSIGYQGTISSSGGTSASAPIWAGIWSLLDQSQGGKGIRNSHEQIYRLGQVFKGVGFHDVTQGDNATAIAGYSALPGYDLVTGWGSPDLPNLIANWNN